MSRLIITADVHGSYSTWLTLKSFLTPEDTLVIAGDLFDTRYGRAGSPDFQPDHIREDLKHLHNPAFYVYGNCDEMTFYPGQSHTMKFQFMGINIFLHHGHLPLPTIPTGTHIVIQGHTHLASLIKQDDTIFFNPGSLSCPRNGLYSYGVIENDHVRLMDLKTNTPLSTLPLFSTCH